MVAQLGQIDHDLDYLQVVPYMPLWKVVVQDPRTDPTQETCATINNQILLVIITWYEDISCAQFLTGQFL